MSTCTVDELAWAVCIDNPDDLIVTIRAIDPLIDPQRIPGWMVREVHAEHDPHGERSGGGWYGYTGEDV